jgi:hypothetical protein
MKTLYEGSGQATLAVVVKKSGQPLEAVKVFASISDPANSSRFSAAAAQRAFAHVWPRGASA